MERRRVGDGRKFATCLPVCAMSSEITNQNRHVGVEVQTLDAPWTVWTQGDVWRPQESPTVSVLLATADKWLAAACIPLGQRYSCYSPRMSKHLAPDAVDSQDSPLNSTETLYETWQSTLLYLGGMGRLKTYDLIPPLATRLCAIVLFSNAPTRTLSTSLRPCRRR